ncbi:hypothetical protein COY16_06230 [Candidatus Roizmanbacteria bacterium CG_4_10_14_0_2_um_filter_39_13]|uniref:Uncharacterized protein n=1 Tax=Candidatus Roizmanbacteria bacterium CG_4_10_14_0_2_um_filter_39_13 TaxID=1974825 RepID=A0A2M7TV20_9BACT|nr:MAG: hypothetical protein COY16_06230 [Candidatus Roizmanbacteria bacterium CG_4_10_14_0_2_um_filter_39_13]
MKKCFNSNMNIVPHVNKWYPNIGILHRIFITLRWLSTPYQQIISFVPKHSNVLDIGCSHGLLAAVLFENNHISRYTGLDPSKKKLVIAQQLKDLLPATHFAQCTFEDYSDQITENIITIIDVFYLLPDGEVQKILNKIHLKSSKKTVLIVNTIDKNSSFGYFFDLFQEIIMTHVLKLTHSKYNSFFYRTGQEFEQIFHRSGYKIVNEKQIKKLLYPYRLFVLEKRSSKS